MSAITETIKALGASFVIKQGKYDLTADAMKLRDQKPLHCGDKYVFTFTLQESDGSAKDLTDCTVRFTAKYAYGDTDNEAIVSLTGTIVNPPGTDGIVTITIAKTTVVGPELIRGYYDLQVDDASNDPETFIYGDIEWLPQVTITVSS
jgi:VCBS repeat-containing protein